MSINTVSGPLIQGDVNNDNNTTRLMKVSTVYADIITDGIATIEDGFISDLIEPVDDNEIATKYYVDNATGSGSAGPNTSIQYNSAGSFAGSANLTLTNPGLSNATLNINGTLTNGTMSLVAGQFSNLTNPTSAQQAATKSYVDSAVNSLGVISINLEQNVAYNYTPAQVFNKIINLAFSPNNILGVCELDTLPTAADMSTYLGTEFTVGKSWTTIFRAPQNGNFLFVRFIEGLSTSGNNLLPISYLYCGAPGPNVVLTNFSVVTITSVVTDATLGSETIYSYVSNYFNNITTTAQITDKGILTPSMGSGSILGNGNVIYPILANPNINGSSPVTYTYANLQKMLIVRTGLTGPTSDSFVSAATIAGNDAFAMGGGTFKFFIQNPTAFALTLSPGTGWSLRTGNNNVIPAGYCGAFWVTVDVAGPSCLLYSLGTNPLDG